jgi:hypothetical protein
MVENAVRVPMTSTARKMLRKHSRDCGMIA